MTRTAIHITLILALGALSACATVDGMGKDISTAGKAISKSAS